MRNTIFLILTLAASNLSFADHHSLTLEARGAQTEWTITSLDLMSAESVITVEREAGEEARSLYSGRAFLFIWLSAKSQRSKLVHIYSDPIY